MSKLEGFQKVAVIKFNNHISYHFAIYDDGTDYKVGDTVFLSGYSPTCKIDEIISAEEAVNNITQEVICKLDTTAYNDLSREKKKRS